MKTIEKLKDEFQVVVGPQSGFSRSDLLSEIKANKPCAMVIRWDVKGDSELLQTFQDANEGPKILANVGVGYNHIDVETGKPEKIRKSTKTKKHENNVATKLKILVTNTPDVVAESTATTALLLMLACARRFEYKNSSK